MTATVTATTSTITVATFNLIATIVGGGVLSVPFAFSKCGGAIYGILWMFLAAICTDQSCVWLCWCARTPTRDDVLSSYGHVGQVAFGPIMEVFISTLLFVFLVFILIAYMVLVKDIWTPVVCSVFKVGSSSPLTNKQMEARDLLWGPYVLLATILFMAPFLLQKSLHALRFNCYVGFASVSILCLALCYHAVYHDASTNVLSSPSFWFQPPHSKTDVITAFPILMLSFLCHFNVNRIQRALYNPTPPRVHAVIHNSMLGCGCLMTLFGVAGYAYVRNDPNGGLVYGNILLNAEELGGGSDLLLTLGRVGCGITIMLAMAIMILPCRDSLLEVLDTILEYHHHLKTMATTQGDDQVGETTPLVVTTGVHDERAIQDTTVPPSLSDNCIAHYTTTLFIVLICYISAVKASGVAIVWSLCGSSMAFSIAFILPAACFLKIVHQREREQENCHKDTVIASTASKALAWVLLVVSILAVIVCTTQTIELLLVPT